MHLCGSVGEVGGFQTKSRLYTYHGRHRDVEENRIWTGKGIDGSGPTCMVGLARALEGDLR